MGPLGKDAGHLDSESKPPKDPSTILIIYYHTLCTVYINVLLSILFVTLKASLLYFNTWI